MKTFAREISTKFFKIYHHVNTFKNEYHAALLHILMQNCNLCKDISYASALLHGNYTKLNLINSKNILAYITSTIVY